jgi:CheY-like chemotaxis protein
MIDARPLTVLIVEDDHDQRYLLSRVLQWAKFSIVAVESGERAVEAARSSPPDVVLLDVQMPGMDGFATARQMKAIPALADVPILFLTAKVVPEDERQGQALGASAYLPKSTDLKELVRLVKEAATSRMATSPSGAE